MNKISGIYQIQSKIKPERIYIGSSVSVTKRKYKHLTELKQNKHHSSKLQRHYNKYGKDDLVFSVLLTCEKEQLLQFEQHYLDFYHPYFNFCRIAGNCTGNQWNKGKKLSEGTKIKIGLASRGNQYRVGQKHSEETKKKMSLSHKGLNTWLLGKKQSLEQISNRCKKLRGQKRSLEVRHKMSRAQVGHVVSAETKQKYVLSHLGKKMSEETRDKMRLSAKAGWEKRRDKLIDFVNN